MENKITRFIAISFLTAGLTFPSTGNSFLFKWKDKLPPEECRAKIEKATKVLLSDDFLYNKTQKEQYSFLINYISTQGKCYNFYQKEYISKCPFRGSIFRKSCFSTIPEKGLTILFDGVYAPFVRNYLPLFKKFFGDSVVFKCVEGQVKVKDFIKKAEKENDKPFCYTMFKNGALTLVCPKWHLEKEFGTELKEYKTKEKLLQKNKLNKEIFMNKEDFTRFTIAYTLYGYKAIREMIEWLDKEFGEKGRGIIKKVNSE